MPIRLSSPFKFPKRATSILLLSVVTLSDVSCIGLKLEPISASRLAESNAPVILSWADCSRLAQEGNPDIKIGAELVKQAQAAWARTFEAFLPEIDGSFGRKTSQTDSADLATTFTLSAGGTQEWFAGFENSADVLEARRNLRAEKHRFEDTKSRVALDVRKAYVRLLRAQELVVLRSSIAERRKLNNEIVRLRYEAGREHRGALKRSEAIFHEAEYDVREAERRIRIEQHLLAKHLGGRYEVTLMAGGELALLVPEEALQEPNFAKLVDVVPSVLRNEALTEAAGAGVIKEQAAFWPSVSSSLNYKETGRDLRLSTTSWDAGFTVNVPLFSGGERLADLYSARSDHREAFYTLKSIRDAAYADLVEKWVDLENAHETIEVKHQFVEAAMERAEISSLQYQDGLVSFEDWDKIEQELVSSRIALLDAELNAVIAEAEWLRSQGLAFDAYRS